VDFFPSFAFLQAIPLIPGSSIMDNMSGSITTAFKHNRARKNVVIGGMVILVAITLLSCVSSFMIYREGFADMPPLFQYALALFAVIFVEGAFVWLVYGFTRAFTSFWERMISFLAMWGLVAMMLVNIITHFMMVKGVEPHPFQQSWLAWGAVSVFIGVLVIVLSITLADPVIRLIRLELKFLGKQQETILNAKSEGLESERVHQAMAQRAEIESEQLAARILGNNTKYLQPHMIKGFSDGGQSSSYSYSPASKDYDPKA
jgi:MFS family permease